MLLDLAKINFAKNIYYIKLIGKWKVNGDLFFPVSLKKHT